MVLLREIQVLFACEGVFCYHYGKFLFGFDMSLGHSMAFLYETYGVILALEMTKSKGLTSLWLE